MSSRVPVIDAVPTSAEQIAAFRLSRHHLIKRAPASALIQVAGDIGGGQGQLPSAPQISLWARPRTRREIAERISTSLGIKIAQKSGRGWGNPATATGFRIGRTVFSLDGVIFLACIRGQACFGPVRGGEATFVRPEKWLPDWDDLPPEKAELELLRRQPRAHGPPTLPDFLVWIGLRAADARDVWTRLEPELAAVDVDGQIGWVLREDLPMLTKAELDAPVIRLLPSFDSFLLGQNDQRHPVPRAHPP